MTAAALRREPGHRRYDARPIETPSTAPDLGPRVGRRRGLIAAVVSTADAAAFIARADPEELTRATDLIAAPWDAWVAAIPGPRPALARRDAWVARRRDDSTPTLIDDLAG